MTFFSCCVTTLVIRTTTTGSGEKEGRIHLYHENFSLRKSGLKEWKNESLLRKRVGKKMKEFVSHENRPLPPD